MGLVNSIRYYGKKKTNRFTRNLSSHISTWNEKRDIFHDDKDKREFTRRLEASLAKSGCRCYAWVLMTNHIHLFIHVLDGSLTRLMRSLLSGYAVYFNKRHKRSGHLFQNRYKSVMCQEEVYLLELVRYIHLNPIRAQIVSTVEDLNNYSWTGHSVIMGTKKREWQNTDEVLRYFSKTEREGRKRYCDFIKDGISMGHCDELAGGGGLRRSAGGWEGLLELKRNKTRWLGDERILGDGDFVNEVLELAEKKMEKTEKLKRDGWTLERIAKEVCQFLSV
ncbi:MAG: transposase, partial [Candidatus Theseobacter exili]|nr:transposase [Candidatus Theseobacter exili]